MTIELPWRITDEDGDEEPLAYQLAGYPYPPTTEDAPMAELITTVEELDALPVSERDALVAQVLEWMTRRGYQIFAPQIAPSFPPTVTREQVEAAARTEDMVMMYLDTVPIQRVLAALGIQVVEE